MLVNLGSLVAETFCVWEGLKATARIVVFHLLVAISCSSIYIP